MNRASIKFIDHLNDLLPRSKRNLVIQCAFPENPSVKHIIESLGVPHTEIGAITIKDQQVDFKYQVQSGDAIIAHPASPEKDQLSGLFISGKMTIAPKFILDNHLGKLATYMRILGFDTIYQNDYQDDYLVELAVLDNRILLTRDRQLLMRKTIRFGYLIRSLNPDQQIIEVIRRFYLSPLITPFHRCLRCNFPLEEVPKKTIIGKLEPKTRQYFHEFHICPNCSRIYWKGSHYERMLKNISHLEADLKSSIQH